MLTMWPSGMIKLTGGININTPPPTVTLLKIPWITNLYIESEFVLNPL